MATYGDVWTACVTALAQGTRFDLEVCGTRHRSDRDGTRVTLTWTLTYWARLDRGDCNQIEAATADEMIARVHALGTTTQPADVGEVAP